jgi:D-serine deaminase-like pyridoxal phosphate-dependent protein
VSSAVDSRPAPVALEEATKDDYERLARATADLDPPFALVDLKAFWHNAADLHRRAQGKPIRLPSKSVRCRRLQGEVLRREFGFRGTLSFTLPEALWLAAHGIGDLLVAYPNAERVALRELARLSAEEPGAGITVMVDSTDHLDLIDAAAGADRDGAIRVCIDVDASYVALGGLVRFGARRSPLRTPEQAAALAREIVDRPGFQLAGMMAYEAQIAGVVDRPLGKPLTGAAIRALKRLSVKELAERRAAVVDAVRAVAPLELVNGGGTGSLESTASEEAVTEVSAGSGLYGPTLFDRYDSFTPRPAAMFALPVVRKPSPKVATVLGGGYLASGEAGKDRLPSPHLPEGLKLDAREGAGEVQTPLLGRPARELSTGDPVFFRHTKAGELCERFDTLYLVDGDQVVEQLATYRGEGQTFL